MFRGVRDVSEPDEGLEVSSFVFWSLLLYCSSSAQILPPDHLHVKTSKHKPVFCWQTSVGSD